MLRNILITSAAVAALAAPAFAMGDKKDIVDTAVEAGSFQTLVTAVKAAGLVETLKGDGPFTVFAPTDETSPPPPGPPPPPPAPPPPTAPPPARDKGIRPEGGAETSAGGRRLRLF